VVTLEPWLEEEELFELELLELVPDSLELVSLSLVADVLADDVVAVSPEVAFACCDALLDVAAPR
jgi:hypothetical protein